MTDLGPMGTATPESLREAGLLPPEPPPEGKYAALVLPPAPMGRAPSDRRPALSHADVLRLAFKVMRTFGSNAAIPLLVIAVLQLWVNSVAYKADTREVAARQHAEYARAIDAHQRELEDVKRELLRERETMERLQRFMLARRKPRSRGISGVANIGTFGPPTLDRADGRTESHERNGEP